MTAYAYRAGFFGWAGAGFAGEQSTFQSGGSTQVQIFYARALRLNPDFAQFTATVNGVARGVTAVLVSNGPNGAVNTRLTLTLASATTPGAKLIVNYVPGGTPANRLAYANGEELGAGAVPINCM